MSKHSPPNELHLELLGVIGLNPFPGHNSSPRQAMFSNHIGQMLVVNGSTERAIQTGAEREFGKYTFNISMPCDGKVLEIVDRYKQTLGKDAINENPETTLIYEDSNTYEIGMVSLVPYRSEHQYFGFRYHTKAGWDLIKQGAHIPKGTVFLDSPSITDEGGYKYGVQANVAFMTHPATSEDGVLVSKSFLPKLGFRTYERRVVEWGSNKFALNLYGTNDSDNYKAFPDIGDMVRDDGLLMALRSEDAPDLAPVERGIDDTMKVDYTFDTTYYANGPGGKVIDIKIHHDINNNNYAETHMDTQAQKYDEARRVYCKRIVDIYQQLKKKRGDALQLTPEFNRHVVECLSVTTEGGTQRVQKLYRQAPLDNFRVEFVIEYNITPTLGFKITDTSGKNL